MIELYESSFYGCRNLRLIKNTESIRNIGFVAFKNCKSLKKINLIGLQKNGFDSWVFERCSNLKVIVVNSNVNISSELHLIERCDEVIFKIIKTGREKTKIEAPAEKKFLPAEEDESTQISVYNSKDSVQETHNEFEVDYSDYWWNKGKENYNLGNINDAVFYYEKAMSCGNIAGAIEITKIFLQDEIEFMNVFRLEDLLMMAIQKGNNEAEFWLKKLHLLYDDVEIHNSIGKIFRRITQLKCMRTTLGWHITELFIKSPRFRVYKLDEYTKGIIQDQLLKLDAKRTLNNFRSEIECLSKGIDCIFDDDRKNKGFDNYSYCEWFNNVERNTFNGIKDSYIDSLADTDYLTGTESAEIFKNIFENDSLDFE